MGLSRNAAERLKKEIKPDFDRYKEVCDVCVVKTKTRGYMLQVSVTSLANYQAEEKNFNLQASAPLLYQTIHFLKNTEIPILVVQAQLSPLPAQNSFFQSPSNRQPHLHSESLLTKEKTILEKQQGFIVDHLPFTKKIPHPYSKLVLAGLLGIFAYKAKFTSKVPVTLLNFNPIAKK